VRSRRSCCAAAGDIRVALVPHYGSFDLFTREIIPTDEIKQYVSKTPMQ
jgi:hypothetical protein